MPYGEAAPASLDDSASTNPLVATLTGALVPRGVLRSESTSESRPNWFATIVSASPSWVTRRISRLRLAVSSVELEPWGFLMDSNLRAANRQPLCKKQQPMGTPGTLSSPVRHFFGYRGGGCANRMGRLGPCLVPRDAHRNLHASPRLCIFPRRFRGFFRECGFRILRADSERCRQDVRIREHKQKTEKERPHDNNLPQLCARISCDLD
jgi:hypothetical protein